MATSSTHKGWLNDIANSRLAAVYNGTEVFDFDANDMVITPATTVTGALTASAGVTATTGGLTATAGGLTVTAGNATFTATDLEMTDGTLALNDGGTVTQATNKQTGVQLNTHTGQITMNNESLAAGAETTFTVTNSEVEALDIILVNHGSAGTTGSYMVQANNIAAGSFDITVTNVSGGALAEAIVLHFAVIHGAAT